MHLHVAARRSAAAAAAGGRPSSGRVAAVRRTPQLQQQQLLSGPAAVTAARPSPASRLAASKRSGGSSSSSSGSGPDGSSNEPAAETPEQRVERVSAAAEDAIADVSARASGAVADAADAAEGAIGSAAASASAAVSDAADVASALVEDAATTVNALAADASAAAAGLQDSLLAAASGATLPPGGPIDWALPAGGPVADPRFAGLRKVLVVGATGGVGRRVVQALRLKGVAVRALVRDRARAANLLPPETPSTGADAAAGPAFEVVVGDVFQFATLPRALEGCDGLVIASGANDKADPLGPFNVDYNGNLNLFAAAGQAKKSDVKRVVLVTSIGTDDILNPLNLFWGILFWKKRAEEALQRSGLPHTIVRPGGLKSRLRQGEAPGGVIMARPGTFGFPPLQQSGSILRSQVADVCVEALICPAAEGKVVEVIADKDAVAQPLSELFEGVRMGSFNW